MPLNEKIIDGLQMASKALTLAEANKVRGDESREDIKEIKQHIREGFFDLKNSVKQDLDRYIEKQSAEKKEEREEIITTIRLVLKDELEPVKIKQAAAVANQKWIIKTGGTLAVIYWGCLIIIVAKLWGIDLTGLI